MSGERIREIRERWEKLANGNEWDEVEDFQKRAPEDIRYLLEYVEDLETEIKVMTEEIRWRSGGL